MSQWHNNRRSAGSTVGSDEAYATLAHELLIVAAGDDHGTGQESLDAWRQALFRGEEPAESQ